MGERQVIEGRFEIADPERDLLGRGGMGDVYRGKDLQTGQAVAIKALRPEVVSGTPDAIARFLREGEALRELDHHNIVKLVDAVQDADAGRHYLVMEHIPGGSLRDLLEQEGRLPIERTVEIALEVADALTRAHHLGIIHRDLKPSNVLLAADETARLTDFGIAQLANGPRLTGADRAVGTVDYMSPEACNLEALDRRTDVWSFGVMLYEMLTGRRPFGGESPLATLTAILTQPLPDLQRLCPDASDALVDLVYRMLEKDRASRVPSVRMVGTELEAILEGVGSATTGAPQAMSAYRSSPPTSRFATPTPYAEAPKHNLPVQVTPFVGREAELKELKRMLTDPNVHLVTVLGPGGMGKTRLALQAAEMLAGQAPHDGYPHGVFYVSLAPLQSREAIVPTVASALGFSFYEGGNPRQQLLDYLREKQMLLLLDNYEHLLEGVDLVADILRTAPKVKVLSTSRARLSVQGEHRFHVAGMDFPDWETLEDALESTPLTLRDATRYSAVKLFLQSARRAEPGFELQEDQLRYVARICRLVGGMPLGILLAAAWVEMLTPEEIAAEIERGLDFLEDSARDLPERQRSVRAVYNHSWNLLAERERAVLAGLSVFRGGFPRDAAQQVTDASLRELRSLVDKSLLQRGPAGRYEIHELLRQYAAEQLAASPTIAQAVRNRHSAYYAAALGGWATDLKGPRQQAALAEMDLEVENARAAWDWAVEQGRVERLDRAMEGLWLFCRDRLRLQEGESAFREAAEKLSALVSQPPIVPAQGACPEDSPELVEGHSEGLRVLAKVLSAQGDFVGHELGRQLQQQSLALLERPELADQDTRPERARILWAMGRAMWYSDYEEAERLYERSLALCRALGDRWGMAQVLLNLRGLVWGQGDYGKAKRLVEESLVTFRALGAQTGVATSLRLLGYVHLHQGRLEEGERLMRESLALVQSIGDRVEIPLELRHLGMALCYRGKYAEAHPLLEQSLALHDDLGDPFRLAEAYNDLAKAKMHLGQYVQARSLGKQGLSLSQQVDAPRRLGFSFLLLGSVALAEEAYAEAQESLRKGVSFFRGIGNRNDVGLTLAVLARAACGLGQLSDARQHLCEATRIGSEIQAFRPCLYALLVCSLLLADCGETERAAELYALASCYPLVANSRWFEDVAGRHIAAAAATLPPEVVAAAGERGRARDLWATVEEMLAELQE